MKRNVHRGDGTHHHEITWGDARQLSVVVDDQPDRSSVTGHLTAAVRHATISMGPVDHDDAKQLAIYFADVAELLAPVEPTS